MKKVLLLAGLSFGILSSAQITLTDADFMGTADSIYYTTGDDFSIDPTPAGPNQTWDYSSLNGVSQKIVSHYDMSDAGFSYQFTYGNADFFSDNVNMPIDLGMAGQFLPVTIENLVGFFKLDANEMTNLGYGADFSGFPLPMQMDTTDTWYEFPINYGDSWSGPSYFKLDLTPFQQDIIYISRTYRTVEVEGWGNLITPNGSYDVLKLKHTVVAEDSLWFGMGGIPPFWIPIPARTSTEYQWIPVGENGPVMVVKEEAFIGVSEVYYKDDNYNPTLTAEGIGAKNTELKVFPNPTADKLTIQTELEIRQSFVFGMDGSLIKEFTNENILDVSALPKGKYILFTRCKEGAITNEFIKE